MGRPGEQPNDTDVSPSADLAGILRPHLSGRTWRTFAQSCRASSGACLAPAIPTTRTWSRRRSSACSGRAGDRERSRRVPRGLGRGHRPQRIGRRASRSRSREREILSRDDDAAIANRPTSIDPERLACARERLARFAFDLGRLRTGVAEVVYMHDVLDCDLSEVAGVLEISVAAAQSRLVRGRRRPPGADCSRPWHRPSRRPTASQPDPAIYCLPRARRSTLLSAPPVRGRNIPGQTQNYAVLRRN